MRILTIHKCKGLEFEKVVVMGVEEELFWSEIEVARAEFFVAVSRAKQELYLTTTQFRKRPKAATGRWDEQRTPQGEFLGFTIDNSV